MAKQLVNALGLIERQHMFVANPRGQITTHLAELKDDIIRLQQQVISATKVERIDNDDQFVERYLQPFRALMKPVSVRPTVML